MGTLAYSVEACLLEAQKKLYLNSRLMPSDHKADGTDSLNKKLIYIPSENNYDTYL